MSNDKQKTHRPMSNHDSHRRRDFTRDASRSLGNEVLIRLRSGKIAYVQSQASQRLMQPVMWVASTPKAKRSIGIGGIVVAILWIFSVIVTSLLSPAVKHSYAAVNSQGPRSATASTDCVNDNSIGTVGWTSPGDAFSSNDTYATVSVDGTISNYIKCTNFGFTIPSGVAVVGIEVAIERKSNSTGNGGSNDAAVRLVKGGVVGTTDRSTASTYTTSDESENHGGSSDLWGEALTSTDVNASNFGTALAVTKANSAGPAHTVSVDTATITVYYAVYSQLNQTGYIWENDDGGVDTNTQQAAGNTAVTGVSQGERLTLRTQIKNTGSGALESDLALFYDRGDGIWSRVGRNIPAVTAAGNCTDNKWDCTTVQDLTDYADYASMAVSPSGQPWVSFRGEDGLASTLVVAQYVGSGGTGCTSTAWTCTTVDDPAVSVGEFTAITFDTSGKAWVSYRDIGVAGLKVAQYVGSGGTGCTSTAWTCTTVDDTTNSVGQHTSIAFDSSGKAWVSYQDQTAGALKVAQYVGSGGTGCTSTAWTCTTVDDPTNNVGRYTSIAFDPVGKAWVSYQDTTGAFLKVAQYVGSGGTGCTSTAWTCTTVDDPTNLTGYFTSIAMDPSGGAWVSYRDASAQHLKVAQYVGSGGTGCTSTAWTCTTVDTGNAGVDTSIAFDAAGVPWVSYQESFSKTLKVARYVGSGGTGCFGVTTWACDTVDDPANDVGQYTSLAFGPDGNAWVSYLDSTSSALKITNIKRSGEIVLSAGLAGSSGDSLSESHVDMTTVTDTSNRDDNDCIGGGSWNNGKWFESEETNGLSLAAGSGTAQCTEVAFTIDTSQAVAGRTYRFIIASEDAWRSDKGKWRGPIAVSSGAYATLTIGSDTTQRFSKDNGLKLPDCTETAWGCGQIDDPAIGVGEYSSSAFDPNGSLWISYWDASVSAIKVARYNPGTAASGGCVADWECSTVDDPSGNTDLSTSIAFDNNGAAWISYRVINGAVESLKVARYVGSNGTGCTNSAWSCTVVDNSALSGGAVGRYSSIAFDSGGNAWISYRDVIAGAVKVARYTYGTATNGICAANWTCTTVDDPANDVGYYTKIAIDSNGGVYIAYQDFSTSAVKVARYKPYTAASGGCAVHWSCTTVDDPSSGNAVGEYISLAIDASNNPWVAYYDNTGRALKVSRYSTGTAASGGCAADWACSTVDDPTDDVGWYPSLAFDSDGNAWVSYTNCTDGSICGGEQRLMVARYVSSGGSGCTHSAWTCTTVDNPANNVGPYTSLAFDHSGAPWISYRDSTNLSLKVAKMHLTYTKPSLGSGIRYPGRSASRGDARYRLSRGKAPATASDGACEATADNEGYCGVYTNDGNYDSVTALANERPMFVFAQRFTNNAMLPTAYWVGKSNVAPSTAGTEGDIKIQVYRFGTTNAWEDVATNSTSSDCSSDNCSLDGMPSGTLSEYFETAGSYYWAYFRVWQTESTSSSVTLRTDSFKIIQARQYLRHGKHWENEIKRPLNW